MQSGQGITPGHGNSQHVGQASKCSDPKGCGAASGACQESSKGATRCCTGCDCKNGKACSKEGCNSSECKCGCQEGGKCTCRSQCTRGPKCECKCGCQEGGKCTCGPECKCGCEPDCKHCE